MKLKIIIAIACFTVFSFSGAAETTAAQSVGIKYRKQVYKRPKPVADHKRTFTIVYPIIKARTPVLSRKITSELSYFKAFDFTLKEELTELQWLDNADFVTNFNDRNILSVELFIEGSAAYPDGSSKQVVLDIRTGKPVTAAALFTDRVDLSKQIDIRLQAAIKNAIKTIAENKDNADIDTTELFDGKKFEEESLSVFSVHPEGVKFYYDFGFPHLIQALEPENVFLFTWKELKHYIRDDGLLATFVR